MEEFIRVRDEGRVDSLEEFCARYPESQREELRRVCEQVLQIEGRLGSGVPEGREPLAPGQTLSHYEILAPLGKGGMGEVYRARDTKLQREVAVKILPREMAAPERVERFEREAKAVAALDHPNIVTIHSVEQADGLHFLTMQLVEGQTLSERIPKNGLSLERLFDLAIPMADAVSAAHERGITHRDLKPANIMVDRDGRVKILDFGLAKLREGSSAEATTATKEPLTEEGKIMGTVAYMSPEQLEGKAIDHRSDLFALGVILYQMASGKYPFQGETTISVISSIMKDTPISVHQRNRLLPAHLGRIVRRALEKDPDRRFQTAKDLRNELENLSREVSSGELDADVLPVGRRGLSRLGVPWKLGIPAALGLAVATGFGTWLATRTPPTAESSTRHLELGLPEGVGIAGEGRRALAISPGGTHVAFPTRGTIYLASLEDGVSMPVRGTEPLDTGENPALPFFNPDGQWTGFYAGEALYKIPITGGAPTKLCETNPTPYGASWGADDQIVYGKGVGGIWRVDSDGTKNEQVIPVAEGEIADGPQALPGGEWILYTLLSDSQDWDDAQIVVQSMKTQQREVVIPIGRDARYVPTGHVVYAISDVLMAVPFDLETRRPTASPGKIAEGVYGTPPGWDASGAVYFGVSDMGDLVYVEIPELRSSTMLWVDRDGVETPIHTEGRVEMRKPILSPDERKIAIEVRETAVSDYNLRVYDLERGGFTQLTHEGARQGVWIFDSDRIVYSAKGLDGVFHLFSQRADGTGAVEPFPERDTHEFAYSWSPVRRELAVWGEPSGQFGPDLWALSRDDGWSPTPIRVNRFNERSPAFSPNGEWVAYVSNDSESGRDEIYVLKYPELNEKHPISTDGGRAPSWLEGDDGTLELIYRNGLDFMAVTVTTEPDFRLGPPEPLFSGVYEEEGQRSGTRHYALSKDGRFLLLRNDQEDRKVKVILNSLGSLGR